jgi:hypothetical protein
MRTFHAIALAALLPLAACGKSDPPPAASTDATATPPADTALGRTIQAAMAKASEKLATENISIGGDYHNGIRIGSDGQKLPRAEITPGGDLLIGGQAVAVTEAQRKLLLEHRASVVAVAQAGIAVGMQGADLGVKAATGALKSVFNGNTDEFERQMEAEGKRIEAEADRLVCARLPSLLASQRALAAAVPEVRPYATMDESDIKDCGKDGHYGFDSGDGAATAQAGGDAAADVEEDAGQAMDAAAEADAAARGSSTRQ